VRTTLTIDDDVLEAARALAVRKRRPFRAIVNDALRSGLLVVEGEEAPRHPYRTEPRPMGLRPGVDLDNVQELLSLVEGEQRR